MLGVNTWESYQAVLEAIRPHQHEFDLIVATGDLAQDQSSAAYQHFAEGIASFRAPCVWLPGNHDFQPAMYSALQDAGISPAKRVFIGEQWQILLLDSQVFGVPHGELSEFQLEWLERKPVSYTHLDVYKRQVQRGGRIQHINNGTRTDRVARFHRV